MQLHAPFFYNLLCVVLYVCVRFSQEDILGMYAEAHSIFIHNPLLQGMFKIAVGIRISSLWKRWRRKSEVSVKRLWSFAVTASLELTNP